MNTFTFIVDAWKNRALVSQHQSLEVCKELELCWAKEVPGISDTLRTKLVDNVLEWYDFIGPDELVDNVWEDDLDIEDLDLFFVGMIIKTDMSDTVFPLREKAKFTFVAFFCDREIVYQYNVTSLEEGLQLWVKEFKFINRQQRKVLQRYIDKRWRFPEEISGLTNVWGTSYKIFRPILKLYIVKTM